MAGEMYAVSGETLTGIADAIRSKTGSDEMMTVAAMASAIEGINSNCVVMKKAAVEGEIIKDKYLSSSNGEETSYGGWDISPYYILDGDYFSCSLSPGKYSTLYNADKQTIGITPEMFMKRPVNAKYLRYSNLSSNVHNFIVRNSTGIIIDED